MPTRSATPRYGAEADARLARVALHVEDPRERRAGASPSSASSSTVATAPARSARVERSRRSPATTSALRICPPSKPISIRTSRQPLATTSVRTPWTASGWTNATSRPNRPCRGVRVDQLRARRLRARRASRAGRRPRRRRGACPGRARRGSGRPACPRRVGASSSTRLVADEHRRRLDALLVERLAVLELARRRAARTSRSPRRGRSTATPR